jgi:hypothetical protein
MGILGELPIEEMTENLFAEVARYDAVNGDRGAVGAFHIIFGTVYADGDIGIVGRRRLDQYIDFAAEQGLVVILDHQMGRYSPEQAIEAMLPYLRYPHVHLALDPEWRTETPGITLGHVTAAEINAAQAQIEEYLVEQGLPGRRMLIVHQFNWRMIQNRDEVRADFERVELVHNADGFGPPEDKYKSWDHNRLATNMPVKGFKLFFPKDWKNVGIDDPLMTPEEVMALEPQPLYINIQ